ncbi:MAG: response regulator transcription factor [Sediminibacterium sp.]
MQVKCVVIDDEPFVLQLMKDYIQKFPVLKLVRTFDDGIVAAAYLNQNPTDLLFLDINMPDISGVELLRSLKIKPITIFTTAYRKFALEDFELDVLDYLLKPIPFDRFCKAVSKSVEQYEFRNYFRNKQHDSLVVRSEYKLIKIDLCDIEYIESVEDYCKIYLTSSRPVLTLMTLKTLLEKLPDNKFKRIHRSYIAPIANVKAVTNRRVQLTSRELPISDSYIGFVNEWMKK